jgi:hypothetical protein
MEGTTPLPPELDEFICKYPTAAIIGALILFYLAGPAERPAWLKDCPRVGGPRNGAWRGKGSFGHGFGANPVRHK